MLFWVGASIFALFVVDFVRRIALLPFVMLTRRLRITVRTLVSDSSAAAPMMIPSRRMRSPCCARTDAVRAPCRRLARKTYLYGCKCAASGSGPAAWRTLPPRPGGNEWRRLRAHSDSDKESRRPRGNQDPRCPKRFGLPRVKPMLEITVAIAQRAAGALSPTMHSAPCPTRYRRLLARVTRSRRIGALWLNLRVVAQYLPGVLAGAAQADRTGRDASSSP